MERNYGLANGVEIPCIGFGTYLAPDGLQAVDAVECAIADGYRLIDTAAAYGNEKSVGIAIARSGISRNEIFVTSKVWNTDRGYDTTLRAFEKTSANLGIECLDLYLIHWPASASRFDDWKEINAATWKALEKLYADGRVRAIGVSNFMPHHLEALFETASIAPVVNQIEYHPGLMQKECVDYCRTHGILIEAWSPLGRGRVLENSLLLSLAEKYGRSIAQICLRWEIQHGILPLPKSVKPQRIKENFDVFGFKISPDDMLRIDNMGSCGASGLDPDTVDF